MNNKFSRVALLPMVVLACTSVPAQEASNPEVSAGAEAGPTMETKVALRKKQTYRGQQLVLDARKRTEAHATVKSRLRVRTNLMGQPLVGSGEYAQLRASRGLLLRFELTIQAGGQSTSVKQVCDGRHLWVHRRLTETESLSHIDLLRVERALAVAGTTTLEDTSITLASGGLPKLLSQLAEHFDFDKAPLQSGQLPRVPVWTATGVWKLDKLRHVAPAAVDGDQVTFNKLPSHLPHQIEIQFGQQDLFPYKLTYYRWEAVDDRHQLTPAITTEFFEVTFGQELDPQQFDYRRPSNVGVVDHTDLYLQNLGVATAPSRNQTR